MLLDDRAPTRVHVTTARRAATHAITRADIAVPAFIRIAQMAAVTVAVAVNNHSISLLARLTGWDANYYAKIARGGYPNVVVMSHGKLIQGGQFAFSPLYPSLVALVRALGFSTRVSLLTVSVTSAVALSVLVHLLTMRFTNSRRAGYIASALLGVLPMAVALQIGYAESLALALSAAALLMLSDRRWWWASAFTGLAVLARPTAIVVALAIPATGWVARKSIDVPWRRVAAATAVAVSPAPMFWAFVWFKLGEPLGWFHIQQLGWQTHFDFGVSTVQFLLSPPTGVWPTISAITWISLVVALVAAVLVLWNASARALPFIVVIIGAMALDLGSSNPWVSKPRILLAAFPIVVLAARWLAQRSNAVVVNVLMFGFALSTWASVYGLTVWHHQI